MTIVCLMAMVVSANAHNTHYPTYTEDGITYVKSGTSSYREDLGHYEPWVVLKVDKPNDKTITIPSMIMINGENVVISEIREEAFSTCVSLDSLIISNGVSIGAYNTFKGCRGLKYLYYSNGGYRGMIGDHPATYYNLSCKILETSAGCGEEYFWKAISKSLEKIIIKPEGSIHTRLDICKELKTIICYATNPPYENGAHNPYYYSCSNWNFESDQWNKITLYVPRESLEKYYFDRHWGEIDNIYAIDEMPIESNISNDTNLTASIDSITNNSINDNVWYSLNGTRVDNPTNGIYIKNGKKYTIK